MLIGLTNTIKEPIEAKNMLSETEIVDKLIRHQFSQSQVESIINNYLDEPNEKHNAEFQELQAYRKACKQYAKD